MLLLTLLLTLMERVMQVLMLFLLLLACAVGPPDQGCSRRSVLSTVQVGPRVP